MRKLLVSLLMSVSIAGVHADDLALKSGYPQTYTVKKGDTLWEISGKFLKQPWRWPELWNLNKDDIKNPHWIYPGDLITLDFVNGKPRLSRARGASMSGGLVKLSPQVRIEGLDKDAIPAIPSSILDPFLSQPYVITDGELKKSPRVAAGAQGRQSYGVHDYVYAIGLKDASEGSVWQIFRQGRALIDPDDKEKKKVLGYEALYLGDAQLNIAGEVSKLEIMKSEREISDNDRLIAAPAPSLRNYVPHPVPDDFKAKVVSTYGDWAEGAQYAMVVINKGEQDGVEVGHVLNIFNAGRAIRKETDGEQTVKYKMVDGKYVPDIDFSGPEHYTLPEEAGRLMVFKVLPNLSYALVITSNRPVQPGDILGAP